jgi:hypothetical protein
MRAGIDFGRGEVKAMFESGRRIRFPSVLGEPVQQRFKNLMSTLDANGHIRARIINPGGHERTIDRMVGTEALLQSEAARAELVAERKNEDILALVAEAFLQGNADGDVYMVVGAPVDHYQSVKTRWVVDGAHILKESALRVLGAVAVDKVSRAGEGKAVRLLGTVHEMLPTGGFLLADNSGMIEVCNSIGQLSDDWIGKQVRVDGTAKTVGKYRDLLRGQWNINEAVYPNVVDVVVLPEPAGAIYNLGLGLDGKIRLDQLRGTVGVIDVGTFSTDALLFTDLRFRDTHSFSIPMGVSYILNAIKTHVRDRANKDAPYFQYVQALQRGSVIVDGDVIDLGEIIKESAGYLASNVLGNIQSRWDRVLDIQRLLVVGGGAYYIFNHAQEVYPHAERQEDPEWANASGFLAYALRRFQDQGRTL